ncbi:MAG: hypothetical protein UZ14_CFX002000886 [Chloroflexi bacterium OLB14]|nr:MAG: hypothetical protein UZ14_CFX002000886 [Chloroflexi bacterium OLB14]
MYPSLEQLQQITGNAVKSVRLEPTEFSKFKSIYIDRRNGIENQKLLEYFISYQFLQFNASDVYIDIAAQDCPFALFIGDTFHCKVFRQDLYYMKKGIHGTDIGGDASHLPLNRETVSKISLHNSFEHFEGESDINFITEAQRILKVGGKMIIVPTFFEPQYRLEQDAGWLDSDGEKHLWGKGARFSRYYDVEHFQKRIVQNATLFNVQFYYIENISEMGPDCYGQLFAIFEKNKPYVPKGIIESIFGR